MSTTTVLPANQTAIQSTVANIETQIATWAPTAIQTAQAAAAIIHTEATSPNDPSATKLGKALGLILLGGQTTAAIPNPNVAAIGGLITLIASLVKGFNDAGFFQKKPKPVAAAVETVADLSGTTTPTAAHLKFSEESAAQKLATIATAGVFHATAKL